uniref:Uncharacterized protein n=1 Tax=Anopheles dirus TaxID=7168 RepID=A0A182NUM1_9DIPT
MIVSYRFLLASGLRFDEIGHDLFTDSDSLSYASLSRSSSLIQFESLERQLQNETSVNQHPLSGSSPSLYTTDATIAATATNPGGTYHGADATTRGKSANGGPVAAAGSNLLTTSNLIQKSIAQTALNISDSELYSTSSSVSSTGSCSGPDSSSNASSTSTASSSSSSSSGFRYTDNRVGPVEDRLAATTPEDAGDTEEELLSATVRCHSSRCSRRGPIGSNRNKNSIESLSEDSGYCDHLQQHGGGGGGGSMNSGGGGLRARSKSLTNFGSAENITFVCGNSGGPGGVGGMFPSTLLPQQQQQQQHHHEQPLSLDCMVTMETRHVAYHENRLSTVCDVDEEEEEEEEEQESTGDECSVAKCIAPPPTQQHPHEKQQQLWTNINNGTKIERGGSGSCKQQTSESPSRTVTSVASSSSPCSGGKNSTRWRPVLSLSAPDLLQGVVDRHRRQQRRQADDRTKTSTSSALYDPISFAVSSVPECLNLYGGAASSRSRHGSFDSDSASSDFPSRHRDYSYGGGACGESVASKNFNLYDLQQQQQHHPRPITSIKCSKTVTFQTASSPSRPKQNIRASYANLTALNYSDDDEDDPLYGGRRGHEYYLSRNTFRTSSGTRLGGGGANRTPPQTTTIVAPRTTTLLTVPTAMDHQRPLLPDAVVEEDLADDEESSIFPVDRDEKSVFHSLLEEMSAHFDRNLSIINDQAEAYEPIAAFLHEQRSAAASAGIARLLPTLTTPPQAPPRRTQIKTNPHHPTQQPPTGGSASALKVAAEVTHHHHHQRRTFDQDPTNLVTCYAASLERCTFDPTESSSTSLHGAVSGELHTNALPRYVPVPKKREFVASTPNLHYYHGAVRDGGEGAVDDGRPDHHNSLRNVATCRSTGSILATASSSRCGLSKGVSFCPIVSEIIWKSTGSSELDPDDNGSIISNHDFELDIDEDDFEADDLDHVNLVRNTANNGSVGEFVAASVVEPMHTAISVKCESAPFLMIREEDDRAQVHPATQQPSSTVRAASQVQVNGGADVKMTSTTSSSIAHDLSYGGGDHRASARSRMSESDPSVAGSAVASGAREEFRNGGNSANGNGAMVTSRSLIASEQQMRAVHNSETQCKVGSAATMPNPYSSNSGGSSATNNTNSSLIKNFKNGKAEKKGKTFLSRISSGFRFSFRNKSKKGGAGGGLLKESASFSAPSVVNNNNNINAKVGRGGSTSASNDSASADFIYIPLKDPRKQAHRGEDEALLYLQRKLNVDGVTVDDSFTGAEDEPDDCEIAVTRPGGGGYYRSGSSTALNGDGGGQGADRTGNHVLSSKPPLPKQPPRVVGVCAKRSSASPASLKHAHAQRASSTPPRDAEQDELDASTTSSYGQRRSPSQQHQYAASNGGTYYHPATHADTVSVEGYGDEDGDYGYGYGDAGPADGRHHLHLHHSIMGSEQKIGLIETNLDTHETIISGKTRSLMELGGGQHYHRGYGHHQQQQQTHPTPAAHGHHQLQVHDPANLPRPTNGLKEHHHRHHHQPGPTDGPGRPHKSMEFLLDKENQRNVLVSLCLRQFLCFFVRTSLDRSV